MNMMFLLLLFLACSQPRELKDTASEFLEKGLGGLTPIEYQGKKLYENYCAICHGDSGKGDGFNAYNLNPPPPDLTAVLPQLEDTPLLQVIDGGTAAMGKSAQCPPRKGTLTTDQQLLLRTFLRRLQVRLTN